jgi:hypothetical protein
MTRILTTTYPTFEPTLEVSSGTAKFPIWLPSVTLQVATATTILDGDFANGKGGEVCFDLTALFKL